MTREISINLHLIKWINFFLFSNSSADQRCDTAPNKSVQKMMTDQWLIGHEEIFHISIACSILSSSYSSFFHLCLLAFQIFFPSYQEKATVNASNVKTNTMIVYHSSNFKTMSKHITESYKSLFLHWQNERNKYYTPQTALKFTNQLYQVVIRPRPVK